MILNHCYVQIETNTSEVHTPPTASAPLSHTLTSSGPGCIRRRLVGAGCWAPPARTASKTGAERVIGPGRLVIAIRSRCGAEVGHQVEAARLKLGINDAFPVLVCPARWTDANHSCS